MTVPPPQPCLHVTIMNRGTDDTQGLETARGRQVKAESQLSALVRCSRCRKNPEDRELNSLCRLTVGVDSAARAAHRDAHSGRARSARGRRRKPGPGQEPRCSRQKAEPHTVPWVHAEG